MVVPGSCTEGLAIVSHAQATHTVLVSDQRVPDSSAQSIPHVAAVVIIASKQEATSGREIDGGDSAQDFIQSVEVDLAVRADVE